MTEAVNDQPGKLPHLPEGVRVLHHEVDAKTGKITIRISAISTDTALEIADALKGSLDIRKTYGPFDVAIIEFRTGTIVAPVNTWEGIHGKSRTEPGGL